MMMIMLLQLGWRNFSHLRVSKIAREISFNLEETFLCPHISGFMHPSKSILDMCRAGRFFCLFWCTSFTVSGFFEFLNHKLELCAHSLGSLLHGPQKFFFCFCFVVHKRKLFNFSHTTICSM